LLCLALSWSLAIHHLLANQAL
jgi:Toprim domain